MQVWNSVKVKTESDPHFGEVGVVRAINGDKITVKLDLVDEVVGFDVADLVQL